MEDSSGFLPPGNVDPFLTDTVMMKVLAKVDINHMKKLRKLGIKWNQLIIKSLEKKASILGQLKAVDLSKEPCGGKIANFLHSSSRNPGIFRSFILDFESLVNCKFISQSKAYSPLFLKLHITSKYTENDSKALNRFLTVIAPEIRELEVHAHKVMGEEEYLYFYYQPLSLVFPKLTRFACIGNSDQSLRHLFRPFIFLTSKDGFIDHTPNLTALEMKTSIWAMYPKLEIDKLTPVGISRWSRLTKLSINYTEDYRGRSTIFLQSLGQAGMRLESLDFKYAKGELPSNCQNLTNFFQTQAKSLQILDFTCDCIYPETDSKIQLPIFEVLHTLKLKGAYYRRINLGRVDRGMFEMRSLSAHFPKLDHLEVNCDILKSLFPIRVPTKPMSLQSLSIHFHKYSHDLRSVREIYNLWKKTFKLILEKFESVVHFRCDGSLLQGRALKNSCILPLYNYFGLVDGRLPWKESLKVLEIDGVKGPLKLSHLGGLMKLIVIEENAPKNSDEYLSRFKNVRNLKLPEISFKFEKSISNPDMKKFAEYFPFPVIFGSK